MRKYLAGTVAAALTALGLSVVTATPAQAAAAEGTFSALTYNIAGLPAILSSAETDRETSTTTIGRRIKPYDIVNVQEDFNYHSYLYAQNEHPYRTSTTGGVPFGSGLNSLSTLAYDAPDFERVTWSNCSPGSGDCLTPKGFTFMRVRLAEGAYLDVYNLHTDAGDEAGDLTARAANLSQVTSSIRSHSAGNAVLVMGDTNTRYTRTGDTIAEFATDNQLTDAWVQLPRGGTAPAKGSPTLGCDPANPTDDCEVVDKVLYRGSRFINLNATAYRNENARFLEDGTGKMLSDHYPIAVTFAWSTNPAYTLSEQYGGPHGDYFNDITDVPEGAQATALSLRSGARVDQVGLTLANGTTLTHGGSGGTYSSLTLRSDEYVTSAKLCQAKHNNHTRIFHAGFTTNLGRTLTGGSTTDSCVTRTAPPGWQIAGFTGRADSEVDKLGFIYTPRTVTFANRADGNA